MRSFNFLARLVYLLAFLVTACATPTQQAEQIAVNLGYRPLSLVANGFHLTAYQNQPKKPLPSTLHIYLEGDGRPWLTPTLISSDPTPHKPIMLELMAIDSGPSLYLGRPCYFGHATDMRCGPSLWTDQRYSTVVVNAMSTAIRNFIKKQIFTHLVFIGHSGGGTLALLLADQFDETSLVVTIAGNLDTDAWTGLHGFTPLTGSLNPARQHKHRSFPERHYLGLSDTNLPPSIFEAIAKRRSHAAVTLVNSTDHACCWAGIWPKLLKSLPK